VTEDSFAQGLIGVTLDGRYRLEAVLGEGGMGAVFRATQLAMDRKVAVKLLKPHLTSDEQALQRFAREARATMKVESPHAVKVLDFGVTPLRDYYMVLEYLDGRTVQRELEIDGAFAPARVAHVARQALHALGAAHHQGLIHRDVKPDNLLLMRVGSDADYTKILDFGVAKLLQGAAGDPSQLALTAAGMVFGTPEFMSPEQACGQTVDSRSDLYSLAATMFVMLTGRTLFEGKTAIELLTHHARTPAPRLATARPELAAYPELDDLLQRCLAKPRDHRPASAGELARLLAELQPTLLRAPSTVARAPTTRPNAVAASSFVPALRDTAPGVALALMSTGVAAAHVVPARPRRGWLLGLGALVGVALIGVAAFAWLRRSASPSTSISAARVAHADAGVGHVPADAVTAAVIVDAGAPDAAVRSAVPVRGVRPGVPTRGLRPVAPAADEHLRAAEDAFRSGARLRQLAEADLALRANPRNARARFLLGDAQIKTEDSDRGCATLRAIKRYAPALARMREAGCPGD
jgi:serine/threonine-protein kinase